MFGLNLKLPPEITNGLYLKVTKIFPALQGEGPYSGQCAIFIRLSGCNLNCSFCDTEFDSYNLMSIENICTKVSKISTNFLSSFVQENVQFDQIKENKDMQQSHQLQDPIDLDFYNEHDVKFIVITGGEPFRQSINHLCVKLIALGFRIQIETNGTLYQPIPIAVEIVCSPKNNGYGYFRVRPEILKQTICLKFLISAHIKGYSDIADVGQFCNEENEINKFNKTKNEIKIVYETTNEIDQNKDIINIVHNKFNQISKTSKTSKTSKISKIPIYLQPMDEYNEEKNANNKHLTILIAIKYNATFSLQMHKLLNIA